LLIKIGVDSQLLPLPIYEEEVKAIQKLALQERVSNIPHVMLATSNLSITKQQMWARLATIPLKIILPKKIYRYKKPKKGGGNDDDHLLTLVVVILVIGIGISILIGGGWLPVPI